MFIYTTWFNDIIMLVVIVNIVVYDSVWQLVVVDKE